MSTITKTSEAERRRLIDEVVRPGFKRFCAGGVEVFDDFYCELSDRLPVVGSMFAQVDMEQQNQLIRDGIADLIAFADGNQEAKTELQRLSKSHSRSGLGVPPEFYPHWVDALMKTIRKHDAQTTDETEAAWREVLSPGVAMMIEGD